MANNRSFNDLENALQRAIFESMQNYLPSNATFLSERLYYQNKTEENLSLLCECHLLENKPYKVYSLLKKSDYPKNQYIFGIACIKLNKFQEAEKAFQYCLQKGYNESYTAYMLGVVYEYQHNFQESCDFFRKALEVNNTLWVAYEKLCKMGVFISPDKVFLEKQKTAAILKERIINNDGIHYCENQEIEYLGKIFNKNVFYSQEMNLNSCSGFLEGFEKKFSLDSKNYLSNTTEESVCNNSLSSFLNSFALPISLISKFQIKEAINILKDFPENHLFSGWTQIQLGKCYSELRNYQLSEVHFKNALGIEPYNTECMGYYSIVLWQMKKSLDLAHLAQSALSQSVFEPSSWLVVGNCYSLQQEHTNALKYLNRALQLNQNDSYIHCVSGFEHFYLEDFFSARKCFENAISLDSRNYNAWWGLGNIYIGVGKFEKSIECFQRAIKINPINSILFTYLGMAFRNKKNYGEALKSFDSGIYLEEKNLFCKFQKALTLYELKQYELALMELEKIFRSNSKENSIVELMVKIYTILGNEIKVNYLLNLEN